MRADKMNFSGGALKIFFVKCFVAWKQFVIFVQLFKPLPMDGKRLKVVLMDEARDFLRTLPVKAQKKVIYNILKKTPVKEIHKAEEIRKQYFTFKKNL